MFAQIGSLQEVAEVISGQSPTGDNYNSEGVGLPFYQGKKDFQDKYIGEPRVWTRKSTKVAQAGDILLSVRAPVGPINVATQECCIGRGLAAIRAKPELTSPEYLYYFLLSMQNKLVSTEGTVFDSINREQIASVKIPISDLATQAKLVDWLGKAFAEVGALEENFEAERKRLTEFVMTISAEVISGPTSSMEGVADWPTVPLGELCEVLDSKRKPVTKSVRVQGDVPYYGATGVLDYVKDYIFDEKLVLLGEDGAKWGAGDNSAFIIEGKTWVNNHAHVLRPNREKILDEWLTNFLVSTDLSDHVSGVTVPKLNQGRMREIQIPVPPIPVQKVILERLNAAREDMSQLLEKSNSKMRLLAELRVALLEEAFGEGAA